MTNNEIADLMSDISYRLDRSKDPDTISTIKRSALDRIKSLLDERAALKGENAHLKDTILRLKFEAWPRTTQHNNQLRRVFDIASTALKREVESE